jgi:hypothetical protein
VASSSTVAQRLADRASEIASEFVRLKVDPILTSGDAQGLAAKRATTVIPIVSSGDKTATGEMIVSAVEGQRRSREIAIRCRRGNAQELVTRSGPGGIRARPLRTTRSGSPILDTAFSATTRATRPIPSNRPGFIVSMARAARLRSSQTLSTSRMVSLFRRTRRSCTS